ncbi:hypothetical protein [Micromonospora zamorensis]|uniref:hypothetical protein n=1 Tax=Micromonospora zamorensis TaxID=709883 RepID=UPI0033B4D7B4
MGKFLALFNGAADEVGKAELTGQQQAEFLDGLARRGSSDLLRAPALGAVRRKLDRRPGMSISAQLALALA